MSGVAHTYSSRRSECLIDIEKVDYTLHRPLVQWWDNGCNFSHICDLVEGGGVISRVLRER
jgi:hypothetical protein